MTERDYGGDRDYPDGSVGRYVRERWGARPPTPRPYIAPVDPPRRAPVEREPEPYDDDLDAALDLDAQPEVDPDYDADYPVDRGLRPAPGPGAPTAVPGQPRIIQEAQSDLRTPRAPMRPSHLPDEDSPPPTPAPPAPG